MTQISQAPLSSTGNKKEQSEQTNTSAPDSKEAKTGIKKKGSSSRGEAKADHPAYVGRFKIRSRLGTGAFGVVYRAYDPQLDREVALKLPHPGTLSSDHHLARFLHEAKAAAQLHHPHIVPIYEHGQIGDQYYIAARFVKGITLREAIEKDALPLRRVARIIRDLAEALAYAHSNGIVHRDVKPANILLDRKGRPYLVDFGIAHHESVSANLTREGAILGTPTYMAPEQASTEDSGAAQPASDQYSLGVILYELLCGRPPFSGPPQLVLSRILADEPESPRRIAPSIPRDLETICLTALAKRPEDRYPDCEEMADDLRRWLHHEPIRARKCQWWEHVARWCRRKAATLALIAICVLSCALIFVAIHGSITSSRSAEKEHEARKKLEEHDHHSRAEKEALERAAEKAKVLQEGLQANLQMAQDHCEVLARFCQHMGNGESAYHKGNHNRALEEFEVAAGMANLPADLASRATEWVARTKTAKSAQGPATEAPLELVEYLQHLEAGKKAFAREKWQLAVDQFEKAWKAELVLRWSSVLPAREPQAEGWIQKATLERDKAELSDRYHRLVQQARRALDNRQDVEAIRRSMAALKLDYPQSNEALALLKTSAWMRVKRAKSDGDMKKVLFVANLVLTWDEEDAIALQWKSLALKAMGRQVKPGPMVVNPPPPNPRPRNRPPPPGPRPPRRGRP